MKIKLFAILMAMIMCLIPVSSVYASQASYVTADDGGGGGGGSSAGGNGSIPINPTPPTGEGITGIANKIVGAMQMIGYVVAVIMLVYVGIKYLTAGAGQKAEVKSTLVPMLAGAILIVSAVTIASWVWSAVSV